MIILPLKNDKIITKDGEKLTVETYTNLKSEPAVYIQTDSGDDLVYFMDIESINGVNVELKSADKVFDVQGSFKRNVHIPDIGDMLVLDNDSENKPIKNIKLHNKKEGVTKGLLFCTEDGCSEIKEIQGIEDVHKFNKSKFVKVYEDYLPSNFKSK